MSPERQAIIEAINYGYCTPKAISKYVGKPPQTVSKLLYVMCNQGLLQKARYGVYNLIEGSTVYRENIEPSIAKTLGNHSSNSKSVLEPSMNSTIDGTIEIQLNELKVQGDKLESQVQTLADDLESHWKKIEIKLEQWWLKKTQDEKNSQEQIEQLETQVEQLQTENKALQTENLALQEQVERLEAVIKEMQSENESLCQQVQQVDVLKLEIETLNLEKETLNETLRQPIELVSDPIQILENYRVLIQQKRTEIEDSQILQTPDWRTKKARWPKLVDFVVELEQIEPKGLNELNT